MIIVVLLLMYYFCLVPFLIGIVASLYAKQTRTLPFIYVFGYIVYLALFELVVSFNAYKQSSYLQFVNCWKTTICLITIIASIVIILNLLLHQYKKDSVFNMLLPLHSYSRNQLYTVFFTIIIIITSVLFLTPHALDETPELARLALSHNTFFSINPTTGSAYTNASAHPGYLHLFYAFGSSITGIDVTTLIHLVMPFFLVPLFICSYVVVASLLFPLPESSSTRFHFIWLIMLFYFLMLPLEAHVALAPYRNIWNSITLASSVLIPLLFAVCLSLIRHFAFVLESDKKAPAQVVSYAEFSIMLICLVLSIQLCIRFGLVICCLFIMVTIAIIITIIFRNKLKRERSVSLSKSKKEGGAHI